jgi:hypothetical protein
VFRNKILGKNDFFNEASRLNEEPTRPNKNNLYTLWSCTSFATSAVWFMAHEFALMHTFSQIVSAVVA